MAQTPRRLWNEFLTTFPKVHAEKKWPPRRGGGKLKVTVPLRVPDLNHLHRCRCGCSVPRSSWRNSFHVFRSCCTTAASDSFDVQCNPVGGKPCLRDTFGTHQKTSWLRKLSGFGRRAAEIARCLDRWGEALVWWPDRQKYISLGSSCRWCWTCFPLQTEKRNCPPGPPT